MRKLFVENGLTTNGERTVGLLGSKHPAMQVRPGRLGRAVMDTIGVAVVVVGDLVITNTVFTGVATRADLVDIAIRSGLQFAGTVKSLDWLEKRRKRGVSKP